jgi:hypothetical protein
MNATTDVGSTFTTHAALPVWLRETAELTCPEVGYARTFDESTRIGGALMRNVACVMPQDHSDRLPPVRTPGAKVVSGAVRPSLQPRGWTTRRCAPS